MTDPVTYCGRRILASGRRPGLRFPSMPRRFLPALLWLALLTLVWGAILLRGVDPVRASGDVLVALASGPWAAPVLLAAYALRAVLLVPATALALFAGWALGPVTGSLVVWVGSVGSAALAYGVARLVRPRRRMGGAGAPDESGRWARFRGHLARNAFEAILLARLAAVPGDAVNVAAGAARAPLAPFLAATALGGLPGLLAVTWAGASLEGAFRVERFQIRPELVAASLAMAALSLAESWWLRRRTRSGHGRGGGANGA